MTFEEEREKIIKGILNADGVDSRNRMGCSESWYDPYYAIKHTFTDEEINSFSLQELKNLLRLAINLEDAFY